MALSEDQVDTLTTMLAALAPVKHKLNQRERSFVEDQEQRYEDHASEMFMSPRQWKWLESIYERFA
jgi:hypothetical protein